jgi:malonyl-CoA O-methyltransferase
VEGCCYKYRYERRRGTQCALIAGKPVRNARHRSSQFDAGHSIRSMPLTRGCLARVRDAGPTSLSIDAFRGYRSGRAMTNAHKQDILAAFERADHYDEHAVVQLRAAHWLAEKLAGISAPPPVDVLEIGCGTGFLAAALAGRIPDATWLMTDLSPAMIERSRARLGLSDRYGYQVMDGEHPDLPDRRLFDIVCSNLTMQWFTNLEAGAGRLFRQLKPGGQLIFTTLADGTFAEWVSAHAQAGLIAGTPDYPTVEMLGAMTLDGIGGEIEVEDMSEAYPSAAHFLRSLRGIGADTPRAGHLPLAPSDLRKVMRAFDANGATAHYRIALCRFSRPGAAQFEDR